jgi:hypothetical protein
MQLQQRIATTEMGLGELLQGSNPKPRAGGGKSKKHCT